MIFHENSLLADNSLENIVPYFYSKFKKDVTKFVSAAVVFGALMVKLIALIQIRK